LERRGKKLLRPRAVASVSNIEGGLAATVALLVTGNARPSDDDGAAREEREVRASALGGKERERSYYGPKDKTKDK